MAKLTANNVKFTSPANNPNANVFSATVSAYGNKLIIAAPQEGAGGCAYLYQLS